jgi:tetratricopeptide (TPR) repeat protein
VGLNTITASEVVMVKKGLAKGFFIGFISAVLFCFTLSCSSSYNKLAKNYYERGQIFYESMEYSSSIENYSKALEVNPKDPENYKIYFDRGRAYFKDRQYENAIYDYTRALELTPQGDKKSRFLILESRGYSYLLNQQYDASISDYSDALRLMPTHEYVRFIYMNRAWDYFNKKEYDLAINDFTKSISIDETLASSFYGRGQSWYLKGDLQRAMQDAKEALRLNPGSSKYDDFVYEIRNSMKPMN